MSEYYAGMGCKCAAWSANECACSGVDWTPEEVYKLRKQLKALQDAVMAIEPFYEDFGLNNCMSYGETCISCCTTNYNSDHEPNCPVTKLREVLKAQGVSDE